MIARLHLVEVPLLGIGPEELTRVARSQVAIAGCLNHRTAHGLGLAQAIVRPEHIAAVVWPRDADDPLSSSSSTRRFSSAARPIAMMPRMRSRTVASDPTMLANAAPRDQPARMAGVSSSRPSSRRGVGQDGGVVDGQLASVERGMSRPLDPEEGTRAESHRRKPRAATVLNISIAAPNHPPSPLAYSTSGPSGSGCAGLARWSSRGAP